MAGTIAGPGTEDGLRTIHRAGFVLAGGRSSRMGRDKALLPFRGTTLLEHVAEEVRQAAGHVTIIGSNPQYQSFGLQVIEDTRPGCGPLGGLFTALSISRADWNLVVACDMPAVNSPLLREILSASEKSCQLAVVPRAEGRWEPLCAVYHRSLLPRIAFALDHKLLKMQDFVDTLDVLPWPLDDLASVVNVNTPEDWKNL